MYCGCVCKCVRALCSLNIFFCVCVLCMQFKRMKTSACYKDFVNGRWLWHQVSARADLMRDLVVGTWKRYEDSEHNDYVTCDQDGWLTFHSLDHVGPDDQPLVQLQYRRKSLYFHSSRLLTTRSTDDRLVWKTQLTDCELSCIFAKTGVRPARVVVWVRVTPAPVCDIFTKRVML